MVVGPYQVPGGPGVLEGLNEDGGGDSNPVKERELGTKDLFSKELWLITTVLWLVWPIGELAPLSLCRNQSKSEEMLLFTNIS